MEKKQRIRFIVNPFSGAGRKKDLKVLLNKYLNHEKFEYEICQTKAAGHGKKLTAEAIQMDCDIVVAVGGDGTVNEVSSVLIGTKKVLGIIPAGSGNGFATHLGISRDTKKAIEYLNNAKPFKIDTCQLNQQKYVNVAGVGFPACVVYKSRKSKFRGILGYLRTSFAEYFKYQMQTYTIKIDGKEIKRDCFCVEVANASMYGYHMKIAPNASLIDGLLDVVIIKKVPMWRYFFSMWRFMTGTVHKSHLVETYSAKNVEIQLENESPVHVDGEGFLTNEPLKFSINRLSLNVLKN